MTNIITVRATINLAGLGANETAPADADNPYVAECIANGLVVPVNAPKTDWLGDTPEPNWPEEEGEQAP